jgi:hypothetical protein
MSTDNGKTIEPLLELAANGTIGSSSSIGLYTKTVHFLNNTLPNSWRYPHDFYRIRYLI